MITQILSFRDMTSSSGKPYVLVETTNGKMSCWDSECIKGIKMNVGRMIDAETKTVRGYTSIINFVVSGDSGVTLDGNTSGVNHSLINPHTSNSNGARVGMAVNNAVAIMLSPHGKDFVKAEDVDIFQGIARCAEALISMCKSLEKK